MRITLLAVLAALALPFTAAAQRRAVADPAFLPEAQLELALQGDDYVFGSFHLLTNTNSGGTFAGGQLKVGYEHFWNPQWSWGATLQATNYQTAYVAGGEVQATPEILLRHWNTFGGFNFRQRAGLRYAIPFPEGKGRGLVSLRLDLDRPLNIGRVALRPRVAVEPIVYLRLQRPEDEAKEPFLDFANFRAELGCRVSDYVDFTPFVAYQSAYSLTLPQFDIDGNISIPGGRFAAVQPIIGLETRVTLFTGGSSAKRRQLPTQH